MCRIEEDFVMDVHIVPYEPALEAQMIRFLKRHEDFSLFLLGNFVDYGPKLTKAPYSGNFKLAFYQNELASVFCLTKSGILLITAKEGIPLFDPVYRSCKAEGLPIKGLIGKWEVCFPFWNFIKQKEEIEKDGFAAKQVLLTVDIRHFESPLEPNARALTLSDVPEWLRLRLLYIQEERLPNALSDKETEDLCYNKAAKGIVWGLFEGQKLVSIAELNAQAYDLGQVGGVYTLPQHRRKGFSRAVMRQLFFDCSHTHHIRKLVIFTAEQNSAARTLYTSLGASQVGIFATLCR